MRSEYNVQMNGVVVGRAQITREGLYLHIICKCSFAEAGVYKIEAEGPSGTVNLGTCVQSQGIFGLDTRVPVKRLGIGEITFRVAVPQKDRGKLLVPVSEEDSFAYLARLRNARLFVQNGKYFIELRN